MNGGDCSDLASPLAGSTRRREDRGQETRVEEEEEKVQEGEEEEEEEEEGEEEESAWGTGTRTLHKQTCRESGTSSLSWHPSLPQRPNLRPGHLRGASEWRRSAALRHYTSCRLSVRRRGAQTRARRGAGAPAFSSRTIKASPDELLASQMWK